MRYGPLYLSMSNIPSRHTIQSQRSQHDLRGFTLVEISIVLLIIGILASIFALPLLGRAKLVNAQVTQARLSVIETALSLFIAQNHRLPCPANGALDATNSGVTAAGTEANVDPLSPTAVCALTNQQGGVVPWKALGLSLADVTDGWGNVMTYRVDDTMIRPQSMNLTLCSPGGGTTLDPSSTGLHLRCNGACTASTFPGSCTSTSAVVAGRGIRVKDIAGDLLANPAATPSTGVAYVVISHGENGVGAYTPAGVLVPDRTPSTLGTEEAKNAANLPNTPAATYYLVDNPSNYVEDANHFDDLVLRKTQIAAATKALLGPRAY